MQSNEKVSSEDTWAMAHQWVSLNRKLIRQVASPYFKFMVSDNEDLYQEATIAVFKALISSKKKGTPDRFIQFFRVIFKTNCIKLASGIQTVHCLEDYFLPTPETEVEKHEPDNIDIERALNMVTKRQREICLWLLQQPTPVSTPDIAKQFQVSRRHACRLVSGSIEKIQGDSA